MLQVRVLPGLLLFSPTHRSFRPKGGKELKKLVRFFKESFAELKKVTWPSREEVASSTKVVLVSVVLIALALGVVDFLIFRGIDLIF
jgi:preprotein translocase subunit SecE